MLLSIFILRPSREVKGVGIFFFFFSRARTLDIVRCLGQLKARMVSCLCERGRSEGQRRHRCSFTRLFYCAILLHIFISHRYSFFFFSNSNGHRTTRDNNSPRNKEPRPRKTEGEPIYSRVRATSISHKWLYGLSFRYATVSLGSSLFHHFSFSLHNTREFTSAEDIVLEKDRRESNFQDGRKVALKTIPPSG